jgi:hypothetical protein
LVHSKELAGLREEHERAITRLREESLSALVIAKESQDKAEAALEKLQGDSKIHKACIKKLEGLLKDVDQAL